MLAVATFASVRSANRSARIAEQALQEQRRPLLASSRLDDPAQKIMFIEGNWVTAGGSRGVAEHVDGNVYLALSLRNVGSGIAVCQGWWVSAGRRSTQTNPQHAPEEQFHVQSRDLYIPGGDVGMWQGALRDRNDPTHGTVRRAIEAREPITIELLYSDQTGGQRTISRFGLSPAAEDQWFASLSRHWYLDHAGPRSESERQAAAQALLRADAERQAELARGAEGAPLASATEEAPSGAPSGMTPETQVSSD